MEKIKIVILDDEEHSVETLAWKIERFFPEVEIIAKLTDASEALEFLQKNELDLLFLDIEMPQLNGFEVIDEIKKPLPFEVIFITAYDEFGIKAVKVDALDYLLKPVQSQELKAAMKKFKSRHRTRKDQEEEQDKKSSKIALSTNESIEFVSPAEIIMCSSESNYTMIYLTNNRKKLISKTLKEVETWVAAHGFYRAHNSHLVNLNHIKAFVRAEGGYLLLSEELTAPVSRNRKDDLLKLI